MKLLKLFSLLICLAFLSCGDDPVEDCNSVNFATEFNTELNEITAASQAFGTDPSTENCNAFKDAYNNYIDALENFEDCAEAAGQTGEWQAALDSARDSINSLMC